MTDASFAMLTCACGAEKAVKSSMAETGWRLAFSRPGFVTAKNDTPNAGLPSGVFIRTAAHSLGQSRSEQSSDQIRKLIETLPSGSARPQFDELHVWPKDRVPIGKFGFEPGIDEVARSVADEIHGKLGTDWLRCDAPNRIAEPGARVLDIVLVDPSHWFFGSHTSSDWPTRWPGGIQPIVPQYEPISRAYYKAAEAIAWSGFEMQAGDLAIEIGSAPGGACGRLLEQGLQVIGIDPADMDPRIASHPRYRHFRARAGDLPRRVFRDAKWMLVDSNVRPEKTLVTVENIVTHPQTQFEGLLITMKIGDYESLQLIDQWRDRIERWKPESIAIRQLARNKVEVCFAVRMRSLP
ncbi:MAG: SAM-dependent methyltransferase [Planctomycetota bacterium]